MEVSLYNYKNDSKITGTFLGFVEQLCLINNGFNIIDSFNKITLQKVIYETCIDYHYYSPLTKGYPIIWLLKDETGEFQGFAVGLQPIKGVTPFIPEHVDYCEDFYIGSLYVLPRFQNKGGGTLLLNNIFKYCKDENYTKIFLNVELENVKSFNYYIKLGFKKTGYNEKNKVHFMERKIE